MTPRGGRRRPADPVRETPAAPVLGEQAIVVGASIAGLVAARVLSDFYRSVTVLDRDSLPAGIHESRRAVRQDRHIHGLQPGGQLALEQLFPGLRAEARAAGAPPLAFGRDMRFRVGGHLLARVDLPGEYFLCSRALLEGLVRRRTHQLSNVTFRERWDVLGLAGDGRRVAGVRAVDRGPGVREQTLRADLVVAASGRGGKVPAWLDQSGYPRPAEQRVKVDILYASRYLRLRPGALGRDKVVLDDAFPGRPRGIAAQLVEGARWIVTLYGYGAGHHPPADCPGWMAFAATVADREVLAELELGEPLGEIYTHAFVAGVRRRYDRLQDFPEGLLVTGDAMCSLNPIYGQGMSVAALEAVALEQTLRDGDRQLGRRFFKAAQTPVDHAWRLATGADQALPELGLRPSVADRVINRYLDRLVAGAETDELLARLCYEVSGMLVPPTRLLAASAIRTVLRSTVPRRERRDPGSGTPPC